MLFTITVSALALLTTISAFPIQSVPTKYYYAATHATWHSETGQVEYDQTVPAGRLYRSLTSPDELTTLVGFQFDPVSDGKTCQFMFELDGMDGIYDTYNAVTGAGTVFDVFTSLKPIMSSVEKGSSNFRGQYIGRMRSVAGGQAVPFYAEETMEKFQFPCPLNMGITKQQQHYEIVPVGENSDMTWGKNDGPWIKILD
jgi:hypothetical protein